MKNNAETRGELILSSVYRLMPPLKKIKAEITAPSEWWKLPFLSCKNSHWGRIEVLPPILRPGLPALSFGGCQAPGPCLHSRQFWGGGGTTFLQRQDLDLVLVTFPGSPLLESDHRNCASYQEGRDRAPEPSCPQSGLGVLLWSTEGGITPGAAWCTCHKPTPWVLFTVRINGAWLPLGRLAPQCHGWAGFYFRVDLGPNKNITFTTRKIWQQTGCFFGPAWNK